jgi:hypothetical protein
MFAWISKTWTKFTNWCAKIAPGVKTFTIAFLGILGSFGAAAQEYVTQLPLTTFVTAEKAAIISGCLFTMIFITRALTNVAATATASNA